MKFKRFALIALALCILGASLVFSPGSAHAQVETQRTVTVAQVASHPAEPQFHTHGYWNGILLTLSKNDEFALMAGGLSVAALIAPMALINPIIGIPAAGVLAIAYWRAGWDYDHNQCDWYWFPFPGYGTVEIGTYGC